MTQKGATATFLPWVTNRGPPAKDCVIAISGAQIDTDRCGNNHIAVCECEPWSDRSIHPGCACVCLTGATRRCRVPDRGL